MSSEARLASLKQKSALQWKLRLEERRKIQLESQKKRKDQLLEELRNGEVSDEEAKGARQRKKHGTFITNLVRREQLLPLMYEEYLIVHNPTDGLDTVCEQYGLNRDEWIVVNRPEGKRVLVITYQGQTAIVEGHKCGEQELIVRLVQTRIPNGNRSVRSNFGSKTILDAVLYENDNEQELIILDVIMWNNTYLGNCPAEFRFYWLTQKWSEDCEAELGYHKVSLAARSLLANYLSGDGMPMDRYVLDGLLLFHKEGHYTRGTSSLVMGYRTLDNCRYLEEILSKPITLRLLYDASSQMLLTADGEKINCPITFIQDTNTICKVKVTLTKTDQTEMSDEVIDISQLVEVHQIEEDKMCQVLGLTEEEELKMCCDSASKVMFYSILNNY